MRAAGLADASVWTIASGNERIMNTKNIQMLQETDRKCTKCGGHLEDALQRSLGIRTSVSLTASVLSNAGLGCHTGSQTGEQQNQEFPDIVTSLIPKVPKRLDLRKVQSSVSGRHPQDMQDIQ